MNASGAAIAAWHLTSGTDHVVQVATRTAAGGFVPAVGLSAPGQDAESATVDINDAGAAIVGWVRAGVVQARIRPAGEDFAAPDDLSVAGTADSPKVAINEAGDAIVAWRRFEAPSFVVQARVRPAGATSFSPVVDLSDAGQNASSLDLAIDAAGNAVVVWEYPSGANKVVQLSRRPAGGSFTSHVDLTLAGQQSFEPRVAITPAAT